MRPIRLGITGGIGSGKSVVARVLQTLGIPVFDCDAESKQLTVVHPFIRRQLVALVGTEVYHGNTLNKAYLANYLFSSPEHVQQINGIIHPVLKDYFLQWVSKQSAKFVAIESAILIEAGYDDVVDHVVMVSAPLEMRITRSVQRDGVPRSAIEKRIRQQMDDEKKRRCCQFVIVNDGVTPVIPQVLEIINTLSQK